MKANEAPYKIYVVDATFPDYVNFDGSPINTKRIDDHDIKYTRTDAFIEKAISWLKEQDEMIGVSFQEDFLERFKDYMKVEPQVKESAEIQHVNDMYKENGNSLTQEPVSEEFEEAADNALSNVLNTHEIVNVRSCLEMFKSGAKWKEERIMAKAINGIARPDDGEVWCNLKPFNFKDGDKVKVIVIKEE